MKSFRTISRVVVVAAIAFGGNMCAKPDFSFDANSRRLSRNFVVGALNKNFKEYPSAQAVISTGGRIVERYYTTEDDDLTKIVKAEAPQGVVDFSLRKGVQLGKDYGYFDVEGALKGAVKKCGDIVPGCYAKDIVKDTVNFVAPVNEETAYDAASAAVVYCSVQYVLPTIVNMLGKS